MIEGSLLKYSKFSFCPMMQYNIPPLDVLEEGLSLDTIGRYDRSAAHAVSNARSTTECTYNILSACSSECLPGNAYLLRMIHTDSARLYR